MSGPPNAADTGTIPAHVASKLYRHTFWCGQSGSGKTYALGVMLEQVLLHTRLPMLIPGVFQMGARLTQEGGSDVRVPLR